MATSLTLYADSLWISPYVFSSFVALKEKSLEFEVVELSLGGFEHTKPEYQTASLTARVPSLRERDFFLSESSAIAEYLDEAYPEPKYPALFPSNLRDRARARQIMAWLRSDLEALRGERPTVTMFFRLKLPELTTAGKKAADKLVRISEQLIPAGDGCLFGDWCLADSELAFMLHRLILSGHPLPARVLAYAQAQWKRPSVNEFVTHGRPARVPDEYWAAFYEAPLPPA